MLTKVLTSPDELVSKLIFEDGDAVWEAVAYRYEDRGVVCFSVQSGCRIGCSFCGTGKKFIRDLTVQEMVEQINASLNLIGQRDKIQLMSMSMGEPMDNWDNLHSLIKQLPKNQHMYVSTVGLDRGEVWKDFNRLGIDMPNFGLQISLHQWDNEKRKKLLGNHQDLLDVVDLRDLALFWTKRCGKPVYWNYICTGKETQRDAVEVNKICQGMHITCSVLCDTSKASKTNPKPAIDFSNKLLELGMDVSVFDPAGQDTVGGGCGQLLYVQEKLKK